MALSQWSRRALLSTAASTPFWPVLAASPQSPWRLWYREPASRWIDALPLGNGCLGAMVHGGVGSEILQLNEDSLWAGRPYPQNGDLFRDALPRVRSLLFAGNYREANDLAAKTLTGEWGKWFGAHQTLGDLIVETGHAGASNYTRELNLEDATARVRYRAGGSDWERTVFSSRPQQAVIAQFAGTPPVQLRVTVRRSQCQIETSPKGLIWRGQAPEGGVRWSAWTQIIAPGGQIRVLDGWVEVDGADHVLLFTRAWTSFSGTPEPEPFNAPNDSFEDLYKQHRAAHQAQFGRVQIDLGGAGRASVPTDERLYDVRAGGEDPQLAALYFQYGRYLLMSSSQPGSLPANLQGLWNHLLAPPWEADYHLNINIPMNYWPAEVTNLSECHEPLLAFTERLLEPGARVARDFYGLRGSVAHYTTNVWGYAEPGHGLLFGLWPDGLAWLARHFWERWLYTGDLEFLRRRAWPVFEAAARFQADLLVEDPKTRRLVPGPASSPENAYLTADGRRGVVAMGCTASVQAVRDLFEIVIQSAQNLRLESDLTREITQKLAQMPPPVTVGRHGQVMEWPEDFDEAEPGHRHVSHLYSLHPAAAIDARRTPDWARACRVTLERRLAAGSGQTGWSAAWMVNFFARLEDGEKAHEILYKLLRQSTEPNLFDTHPSARGPIFQIDGNLGGCAGIAEMLLQSHAGEIHLLPALPRAWPEGRISGLRARPGYLVDLAWKGGRLDSATLTASRAGNVKIRTARGVQERTHAAGEKIEIRG